MTYDVQTPASARLWSYLPDWRSGFDVRRSFATDIIRTRNGKEQRRGLRDEPRLGVDYRVAISGEDLRVANCFLRGWQNQPVIVPHFARYALMTGASSAGASTLAVSPLPVWAAAGQRLVLCGAEGQEDVVVDSVAGTTITLAEPLANAWGIGSVLRPTFFGLFESNLSSSRITRGAAEVSVSVAAYPGGEPPRAAGTAWATFNGREVFTPTPDHAGPPSLSYVWPVEQVDYGRGRTAQFRPITRAERQLEADFNGVGSTLAGEIEQFFDRHKGRRTAFHMPTWEQDFSLAATASSGSSFFLDSGLGLYSDFGAVDYAEVEECIAVFLTDGTTLYRRVTGIVGSGGNSRVNVSAAWPTNLTTANVARICWMPIWRFASDDMTTSWRTPVSANIRLSFVSVPA